jgi:hypothetical protein
MTVEELDKEEELPEFYCLFRRCDRKSIFSSLNGSQGMCAGADTANPAGNMLCFKDRTTSQETFKEAGSFHDVQMAGFQSALFYIYNDVTMTLNPC